MLEADVSLVSRRARRAGTGWRRAGRSSRQTSIGTTRTRRPEWPEADSRGQPAVSRRQGDYAGKPWLTVMWRHCGPLARVQRER